MNYLIINLAISLLIPFGAGYSFLIFLDQKDTIPTSLRISLAYGLGLGLLAIWMLVLGVFKQTYSLFSIGMPLILVSCIFLTLKLRGKNTPNVTKVSSPSENLCRLQGLAKIMHSVFIIGLICFIAHNFIYVFWRSMTIPVSGWDAIATVSFKAKIIFFEKSLPSLDLLPHKTYPLFVPFVQSWIAFTLGQWSDVLIKIIFPCAFLSYLTIQYNFLAHFPNRTWALLGCAILLSSNFFIYHATISYRDFFLMYFNCTTIMLLLFWNQNKDSPFLILAALFAGFATFTKLEGTAFLGIYSILFLILNFSPKLTTLKEKLINSAKFFLPSFGICLTYHAYKIWHNVLKEGSGIVDKTKLDFTWDKLNLVLGILGGFFNNMIFSGNWNIVWFVALLSLIQFKGMKTNNEGKLVFLSLLLFFGLYFFVALLTVNYVWIAGIQSSTTLSRLILHFYPLSVLLIILLNYPKFSAKGNLDRLRDST